MVRALDLGMKDLGFNFWSWASIWVAGPILGRRGERGAKGEATN